MNRFNDFIQSVESGYQLDLLENNNLQNKQTWKARTFFFHLYDQSWSDWKLDYDVMSRIMIVCEVCNEQEQKYKCPKCFIQ